MADTLTRDELLEVSRFVHRVHHLRARKGLTGYAEVALIADQCWMPSFEVPGWALATAYAGEPSAKWCPIVTPSLRDAD